MNESSSNAEKITVLFGSPHKDGFTAQLLQQYLQEHHRHGEVTVFRSYDLAIQPCTDCGYCHEHLCCWHNGRDGYDQILQEIDRSDVLVIASPVYFFGFPSPLKAIIDRAQQRFYQYLENQRLKPKNPVYTKKGVLLATCGSRDTRGFDVLRMQAEMFYRYLNAELQETYFMNGTDQREPLNGKDVPK